MATAEENEALVRRYFEADARGDLDALKEMLAPDFVDHSPLPGQAPDREGYIRWFEESRAALSGVRYTIEDLVVRGDTVATRLTGRAAHDRGEMLGLAPTGRNLETSVMMFHRISGGKIVEEWSEGSGMLDLAWQQLEQETRERERIEQELRVARRIQHALLPKDVPDVEGWQITPYYKPAREVGGDFYDFLRLEDGHVGLVVGDVTGKGVPAALVMSNTQSVLRTIAQRATAPAQALAEANEVLHAYIPPNMFVTCFYGVLDLESGRFLYANAGHNLPCCRRRDGLADELRATGMPLGLMPGMHYENKETVLSPQDGVLFYSDGLVEAHNPQGEMFGTPRLRSLLTEYPEGGTGLTAFLLEELERFTGEGWEQEDDITLLALRWSASRG
jgi:predicted ester cyclase